MVLLWVKYLEILIIKAFFFRLVKMFKCFCKLNFDFLMSQVHQGLTVYGNKGSTDQHAWVFGVGLYMIYLVMQLYFVLMHLLFFVVTFNNWEKVCTISLWHSLRCFVIDPLVMIGSLNQVSHVVTTSLACYRLDLLQQPVIERFQMALNWKIIFWFCCFSW